MAFSLTPTTTFWLGVTIVILFLLWQYVLKPILNEGQPIDPPENLNGDQSIDILGDISFDSSSKV